MRDRNIFDQIHLILQPPALHHVYPPLSASIVEPSTKPAEKNASGKDYAWLLEKCECFLSQHTDEHIFPPLQEFLTRIRDIFQADLSDEVLQTKLYELIGDEGFEFMLLLMEHKDDISKMNFLSPPPAPAAAVSHAPSRRGERDWLREAGGFSESFLEQERRLGLQKGRFRNDTYAAASVDTWLNDLAPEGSREYREKTGLPAGSTRTTAGGIEEINIPAAPKPSYDKTTLLSIEDNIPETWARRAFPNMTHLNRMQSKVFHTAYHSAENMLVCAPTGAGKTNVAMLTFLREMKACFEDPNNFATCKCVYIAPMKALAQEVVATFSRRLKSLKLVVKEFTGDSQLTRQEIIDSNLIVTTPEKWDVITRKGGDGSLITLVSLIIIDEVHLLADDRGAVLETIVARTQRYIESSQSFVRFVGLSATLPNYKDVASFLKVNHSTGLHYFGSEYRPVPLEMTFTGVSEKQRNKRNDIMVSIAYEKMIEALRRDKQVMIFVHSRKDTSKTLDAMYDIVTKYNTCSLLDNHDNEKLRLFKNQVDKSRSQELQQHFYRGMGMHHAGMLKSDRSLTEKLFECGLIKVLCCTATLAWGVNLPAHTVIIKGTEMYDAERGGYTDISMLDVFQIFGRAGRPQFDTSGHAIMITAHASLGRYIGLLGSQAPIESNFIKSLPDHMNAEIVNGTINNITEASSWLSYTFLFIRMCKNPLVYGLDSEERFHDPQLERKRLELVRNAAAVLDRCMMIRYDSRTGNLAVTDLGRIASHFYIKHDTIEAFNTMLTEHLSHDEGMHVLCSSCEFDQLKLRPEELAEIDEMKKRLRLNVKTSVENTAGKVAVLLRNYITQGRTKSFTLQSDTNYVAQNASRISRALFEICLKRGWCSLARQYLTLSISIDRRILRDQTPLRQFSDALPFDTIKRIEAVNASTDKLLDMNAHEVGQLCHNQKLGKRILYLAKCLPRVDIDVTVHPLTSGIIRMTVKLFPSFIWGDQFHGDGEPFWVWVEDSCNESIYHFEYVIIKKKQLHEENVMEFVIPVPTPLPSQYYVRVVSDRWMGCEYVEPVSFQHLILPVHYAPHTDLLDVAPVPVTALNNKLYEALYPFQYFNPIQSQCFYVLYHTPTNVLIGAPTGSGKTISAELAIFHMLSTTPGGKAVYIAPLKALARERLADWKKKFGRTLGLTVSELSGDVTPDLNVLQRSDIIITTPEKWDGISRGWEHRKYVTSVSLIVIDEIHLLGVERGPVLEVIVSRMRYVAQMTGSSVRFVGLSTALANAQDLGDWLGIKDVGLYNFRPSVRPVPMKIFIQGFPGKHYCPRMATMNKPAFATIQEHSPLKPVLIFVSSRRQTRLTALDLISYCLGGENPKQFLHMDEDEILAISQTIKDTALRDTIVFGVGIHHAGLDTSDREIVEELFVSSKIQVLVCTSTLAWGVNFPAHLVIVKGTEYFDGKLKKYVDFPVTDILQMMGRAGRPQFDDHGIACVFVQETKKNFYKKFLHEPFPVESSLHKFLHNHVNAEVASGRIASLLDCVDYLSWTYYFRRLLVNPSYYGIISDDADAIKNYLVKLVIGTLNDLEASHCVYRVDHDDKEWGAVLTTDIGRIASKYYIDHTTAGHYYEVFSSMPTNEIHSVYIALLVSQAKEFSEVPVRHNEELLNAELAEHLPITLPDGLVMEDSNTKAFLLLQAHLHRVPLPITDYINDTKSVLDQFPRVLNAMIDVAVVCKRTDIVIALVQFSQMIQQVLATSQYISNNNQAVGSRDKELTQFPFIDDQLCASLHSKGVTTARKLIRCDRRRLESIAAEILPTVPLRDAFLQRCRDLPLLTWKHSFQNNDITVKWSSRNMKQLARDKSTWYVILSSSDDKVVALKRHTTSSLTCSIKVILPSIEDMPPRKIHLISDTIFGLDQSADLK